MDKFEKSFSHSRAAELVTTKLHFAKYIMWLIQEHMQRVNFLRDRLSRLKYEICELIIEEKEDNNPSKKSSSEHIFPKKFEAKLPSKVYDNFKDIACKKAFDKECYKFSKSINKTLSVRGGSQFSNYLKCISECSSDISVLKKSDSQSNYYKESPCKSKPSSAENLTCKKFEMDLSEKPSRLSVSKASSGSSINIDNRHSRRFGSVKNITKSFKSVDIERKHSFNGDYCKSKIGELHSAPWNMGKEKTRLHGDYNELITELCSLFANGSNTSVSQKSISPSKIKKKCSQNYSKGIDKKRAKRKNSEKQKRDDLISLENFLDFINATPHLTVDAVYAPLTCNKRDQTDFQIGKTELISDLNMSWPRFIKFNLKNTLTPLEENQETTSCYETDNENDLSELKRVKYIDGGFLSDATSNEMQ